MNKTWFSMAALTVALAAPAGMTATAHAAALGAGQQGGYYQDRSWEQPPNEYRDVQREGFRDGIEAARRDYETRSRKDADDHERYRHPPVDRHFAHDYRDGFKHGYSDAMHHMRNERHDRDDHHDRDDRPY